MKQPGGRSRKLQTRNERLQKTWAGEESLSKALTWSCSHHTEMWKTGQERLHFVPGGGGEEFKDGRDNQTILQWCLLSKKSSLTLLSPDRVQQIRSGHCPKSPFHYSTQHDPHSWKLKAKLLQQLSLREVIWRQIIPKGFFPPFPRRPIASLHCRGYLGPNHLILESAT